MIGCRDDDTVDVVAVENSAEVRVGRAGSGGCSIAAILVAVGDGQALDPTSVLRCMQKTVRDFPRRYVPTSPVRWAAVCSHCPARSIG